MAEPMDPEALRLNYGERLSALDTSDIRGRAVEPPLRRPTAPMGWVAFWWNGRMFEKTIFTDRPGTVLVRDRDDLSCEMTHQEIFEMDAYHPQDLCRRLTRDDARERFGLRS